MAEKKKFLLRIDENVHAALEKWAADDLRSINAQIEYLLTQALKNSVRLKSTDNTEPINPPPAEPGGN
ncbi:MAG: toxin-antitoxin system HicB family antitoxin [bacterium]|nr:toxin-antitoxin system HicB family antitoxin [bacterium]